MDSRTPFWSPLAWARTSICAPSWLFASASKMPRSWPMRAVTSGSGWMWISSCCLWQRYTPITHAIHQPLHSLKRLLHCSPSLPDQLLKITFLRVILEVRAGIGVQQPQLLNESLGISLRRHLRGCARSWFGNELGRKPGGVGSPWNRERLGPVVLTSPRLGFSLEEGRCARQKERLVRMPVLARHAWLHLWKEWSFFHVQDLCHMRAYFPTNRKGDSCSFTRNDCSYSSDARLHDLPTLRNQLCVAQIVVKKNLRRTLWTWDCLDWWLWTLDTLLST